MGVFVSIWKTGVFRIGVIAVCDIQILKTKYVIESYMRKFSDEERTEIRENIVEIGRELFVTLGPKKTNVKDITDQVGIAKSTFYQFFDTKSHFYLEIFLEERDEFLEQATDELERSTDANKGLQLFFDLYLSWIEQSPLSQKIFVEYDYEFFREIPEQTIRQHQQEALNQIYEYIEEWQQAGEIRDIRPTLFGSIMSALALLPLHEEEYEKYERGLYSDIRTTLIELMATGLTTEGPGT